MIENSHIRFLTKGSIFTLLPDALDELTPFMEVRMVPAGKTIFQKGEVLDSLVIPLGDPLSLVSDGKVSFLVKGRALALSALLRNQPLSYDVRSEELNKILILPRSHLMSYFEEQPGILKYLLLMTESEAFRRMKHMLSELGVQTKDLIRLSSIVSSEKEFHETDLQRGLVLFEEGNFNLVGARHSGSFAGGEFVGGYHALYRSNPGYELRGKGLVRLIPRDELRELNLEGTFYHYFSTDPWVKVSKEESGHGPGITSIPESEVAPWNEVSDLFDPSELRKCASDWDAIRENIYHILRTHSIEPNRSLVENRMNRAGESICFSLVAEILEFHGLMARSVSWKEDYRKLPYPMLVPYGNRLVTLLGHEKDSFLCFDGYLGFYRLKKSYLLDHGQDAAIASLHVKVPETEGEKKKEKKAEERSRTLRLIFKVIGSQKKTAASIAGLTFFIYGFGALTPTLNQILLDEVLKTEDRSTLGLCLSGLGLIGAFTILFHYLKNKLIASSALKIDDVLSRFIYREAQALDSGSMAKLGIGGVMSRLMEMEKIRHFFSTESLNVAFNLGSALIFGSLLATYSGELIGFVGGYFLLIYLLQFFGRKYIYKMNLKEFNLQSKINSFIGDSISNVLAIKVFSASPAIAKDWDQMNAELVECGQKTAFFESILDSTLDLLGKVVNVAILWYCLVSVKDGQSSLSFGQVFAILQLIGQTIGPMASLVDFVTNIEDIKLSLDKINDILFSKVPGEVKPSHSVNLSGKIKLDRVSFRYSEDSPLILKDVSLTVYPGQSVAIVGKSGSGKTTIANLIAKENSPTGGRIYLDDVDASFIDTDEVKMQIGYIQQNTQLFSGSIRSNVAYKDEVPLQSMLDHAYKVANCEGFIQSFPQRDDNYLAEGGMGLSGGQKQRLTMARAIYNNPRVLILDEATSALDSESEGHIIQNLLENKGKITSIVIAHRLSTIRSADFVYVVDNGQIVQEGTHNELIQREGVYKELFQDQSS